MQRLRDYEKMARSAMKVLGFEFADLMVTVKTAAEACAVANNIVKALARL